MGMYTEIFVNVDLIEDTPLEIINVLKAMCSVDKDGVLVKFPARWNRLFHNGSYYTPYTSCALLTFDELSKRYSLLGKGDIKNYDKEIQKFFDWIRPYVEGEVGDFIGYYRYEEDKLPTLVTL